MQSIIVILITNEYVAKCIELNRRASDAAPLLGSSVAKNANNQ